MTENIEEKSKIKDNKKELEECQKPSFAKASESKQKEGIEELKKKLEDCQKKSEEYLAGWQRSRADFLNYKKEEIARMQEFLKYANEEAILKILPIFDSFEKAEKEIPADKKDDYLKGLLQIKIQLQDFLKDQGVEEIKALGEKFDPNFHEAVEEVVLDGKESGIIIEEVKKGYLLNGRVVRPAKVRVTK